MNSRCFLVLTALMGLVAAQSSSALTVVIDGKTFSGVSEVRISEDGAGGGGTDGGSGGTDGGSGGNDGGSGGSGGTDGGGSGGNDGGSGGSGGTDGGGSGGNDGSDTQVCSGDLTLFRETLRDGLVVRNFLRNEAYVFKLNGKAGERGLIAYGASTREGNGYTSKLMTIMPCAGDFEIDNVPKYCGVAGVESGVYFQFGGAAGKGYCPLDPNQTYYVNIRNFDFVTGQDSCPRGQKCGFSMNTTRQ